MIKIVAQSVACILLFAASALPVRGQVTIAPTFLYIDAHQPFSTVHVINRSGRTQEVMLGFQFGYHASDSLGNRYMVYGDSAAAAAYAFSPKAFPKKFILAAGAEQVVRLIVKPTDELRDGVYWTRVVITSAEQTLPADKMHSGAAAGVNFTFKQVIPVIFNWGRNATRVEVKDIQTLVDDRSVTIQAALERHDRAPFIGQIALKVFDKAGKLVTESRKDTEVYFQYTEQIVLPRSVCPPGRYRAELSLTANRSDVPLHLLPDANPVTVAFAFDVPEERLTPEEEPAPEEEPVVVSSREAASSLRR